MRKLEMKNLLKNVVVNNPCSVGWESMEGNSKVRFCNQCKMNVHNLSNMSEKEAAGVVARRKNERTCVFMYKQADGMVVTDNCPVQVREIRNRIRGYAASALIALTWSWALGASAQGLVGAAVDPRYGQSNEVAQLADYGYDTARDISRLVTVVSFAIAFFVPMDKRKEANIRRVAIELIALACIPILVHLAGTHIINNYGGLGGGF